jgi:tRNA threonylcarbamoyl adenosine modification protein YeaZ
MILCIDSSGRSLSFALVSEKRLVSSISYDVNGKMNENIITLMDKFLHSVAVDINAIDTLVAIIGPGSFTGIRIGMAALGGISAGLGIEYKGISTLDAIAITSGQEKISVAAKLKLDEYAARDYDFINNQFSDIYITDKNLLNKNCIIADEYMQTNIISEAIANARSEFFLCEPAPLYVKKSEAEINFDKKSHH